MEDLGRNSPRQSVLIECESQECTRGVANVIVPATFVSAAQVAHTNGAHAGDWCGRAATLVPIVTVQSVVNDSEDIPLLHRQQIIGTDHVGVDEPIERGCLD